MCARVQVLYFFGLRLITELLTKLVIIDIFIVSFFRMALKDLHVSFAPNQTNSAATAMKVSFSHLYL